MKKIGLNLLIIIAYCFPFVFFAMHTDFDKGSILGYLLMIVGTGILAYLSRLFNTTLVKATLIFIIGNILSAFISYYFLGTMEGNERWDGFFKPFSPEPFFKGLCILNLIPQLIALYRAHTYKKKRKN